MTRSAYPSDLNDAEWEIIKPLMPVHQGVGHPQTVNLREVVNAIFYWVDNGIKWRALPHEFPPWQTVYAYYRRWVNSGLWEEINAKLVKQVRLKAGRNEEPSLTMIDSQSVKSAEKRVPNKVLMAINESKGESVISL